jgi:hypothetical protein
MLNKHMDSKKVKDFYLISHKVQATYLKLVSSWFNVEEQIVEIKKEVNFFDLVAESDYSEHDEVQENSPV